MPNPTADDQAMYQSGLVPKVAVLTESRALLPSDFGKTLVYSGADAIVLTAPATLRSCWRCLVVQLGAGAVSIAAGAGATVTTVLDAAATTEAGDALSLDGVHVENAAAQILVRGSARTPAP
jgi:hypothetical protein